MALHSFHNVYEGFPSSFGRPFSTDWSAQATLLPYLEQENVYQKIDFPHSYKDATLPDGPFLSALRVPTLMCPSETQGIGRRKNGVPVRYPLNYSVNLGVWFVYDPAARQGGPGAFMPFVQRRPRYFQHGLSQTLAMAEVKANTPYFCSTGRQRPARNARGRIAAAQSGSPGDLSADNSVTCTDLIARQRRHVPTHPSCDTL